MITLNIQNERLLNESFEAYKKRQLEVHRREKAAKYIFPLRWDSQERGTFCRALGHELMPAHWRNSYVGKRKGVLGEPN